MALRRNPEKNIPYPKTLVQVALMIDAGIIIEREEECARGNGLYREGILEMQTVRDDDGVWRQKRSFVIDYEKIVACAYLPRVSRKQDVVKFLWQFVQSLCCPPAKPKRRGRPPKPVFDKES